MKQEFLLIMLAAASCLARPQNGFVAKSPSTTTNSIIAEDEGEDESSRLKMSEFHVRSDIQFRYARTHVETYLKNPSSEEAEELQFSMVIPNSAFVSNFSLILNDGTEYVAEVKEKAEAAQEFEAAAAAGQSAGLVQQNAREANRIDVSVSVEPRGKVRFKLVYEELLERRLNKYEHIVHVEPGQLVADFRVDVFINESRPISSVNVPELKESENDITSPRSNPLARIQRGSPGKENEAHISFQPNLKQQKEVNSENGIRGQFIVQYDVNRKSENGEIQLLDGYFVHFFAPDNLPALPKHVVFVLDVSGSMFGEKLDQTKDAMITIIDDMTDNDYFNILTFSDDVYHWKTDNDKLLEGPHGLTYRATSDIRDEALSHVIDLNTIGGTNINDALIAAMDLVEKVKKSEEVPSNTQSIILFLTDGQATTGVTNNADIKNNVQVKNTDLDVPIFGLAFGSGADFTLVRELAQENDAFARRIYEGSDAALQLEDFFGEIANPLLTNVNFSYVGQAFENASLTSTTFGTFNKGKEFVIAGKIPYSQQIDNNIEVIIEAEGKDGVFVRRLPICVLPKPMPIVVDDEEVEEQDEEGNPKVLIDDVIRPPFPFPGGCFPLPPEQPREPRSEHQNFIERLWAFKTVNELLDGKKSKLEERREELDDVHDYNEDDEEIEVEDIEDMADMEIMKLTQQSTTEEVPKKKKKTNKEKAVELALKYNFVTPVTSLVVVKPQNGTNQVKKESVELVPASTPAVRNNGLNFFSAISTRSGGSRPAPNAFKMGIVGGAVMRRRRPQSPPQHAHQFSLAKVAPRPRPQPTTTTFRPSRPVLLSAAPAYDYDDDNQYFDESLGDYDLSTTTTTTTRRTTCQGSISLHDKTYFRGQNVTIVDSEDDIPDLSVTNLRKLFSVEVRGDCCWRIFVDEDYQGEDVLFRPGEHPSPNGFKALFRKASSLQKEPHCA